jgi:hypothetical protein
MKLDIQISNWTDITCDENVHCEIPEMCSDDSFEQLIPGELPD